MLGTLVGLSAGDLDGEQPWLGRAAASATINWILKDGLGQAGGILLVSRLGSRLDSHARVLRFHSAMLLLLGSLLEFVVPWACGGLGAGWFLPVAATANVLKNVGWMVTSATRAHFLRQMARGGNLGDLTGKAASQMTLASLAGTAVGLLAIQHGSLSGLLVTWLSSAAVSLLAVHRSCRVAVTRQLSPQRLALLLRQCTPWDDGADDDQHLARRIWTPEHLARHESFLFSRQSLPFVYNAPLTAATGDSSPLAWIVPFDRLGTGGFMLARIDGHIHIWTTVDATAEQRLLAVITAILAHLDLKVATTKVLAVLAARGWDTTHFSCAPLQDPQTMLQVHGEE